MKKLAKKADTYEKEVHKHTSISKQIYSTDPQTLLRKKSISSASVLIKKVKGNMLDVVALRGDLEIILVDVGPEDFAELKLNEWNNFEYELTDRLGQIKDEVSSLISSTTAYLKEDRSEQQAEIIKVSGLAKKLRKEVDAVLAELNTLRKT